MPLGPYGDIVFRSTEKPTAKEIIEAERRAHEAKTARLRKARFDKDLLAHAPGEPRVKALKAKGRKR